MANWTVLGLTDDDAGELYVAGVVAGKVFTKDTQAGSGGLSRWAEHFEADTADKAAELAVDAYRASLAGEDENPAPLGACQYCGASLVEWAEQPSLLEDEGKPYASTEARYCEDSPDHRHHTES